MNGRDRALKALYIEEPDTVPITEAGIDVSHMEAITGKTLGGKDFSWETNITADRGVEKRKVEMIAACYRQLKFDAIACIKDSAPDDWQSKKNADGTVIDEWGRILAYDSQCRTWVPCYSRSLFETPEDFENFAFPNPNAPGRTFALEYMKEIVGEEIALAPDIRDPFAHAWEMFSPMKFVRWMHEYPAFMKKTLRKITRFHIELIKQIADVGVDFLILSGDYCEKKGPMLPVKYFREIIFPNLREMVKAAHRRGLKVIKHSDGNICPLLDDLANIVDGLHSLDPSAGVDIGEVKRKYGEKLVLMGNVSVDSLARKSKEEVIEETKECMRKASPGGGHFLTSSNTWFTDAKLENCMALVETGRKYGRYPIDIP